MVWVEAWLDNTDRSKPRETIQLLVCNKCHQKWKHSSAGCDKCKPQTRFPLSSQTKRHLNVWFLFFYFFCIGITAFRSSLKSAVTNKGNSCDCRGTSVGLNSSNYPHQDCPRHICTRKILMCSYIVEETFSLHVLDSMLLIYSVVC